MEWIHNMIQDWPRKRKKREKSAFTHLPRTLELDDLVALLVYIDFFLRAVSSVLYEDEQEGADEPRKRVPFHWCVSPCAREALCRYEHA